MLAKDCSIRGIAIRIYEIEMWTILKVCLYLYFLVEQPIANLCRYLGLN
jgi:hypothetical protein